MTSAASARVTALEQTVVQLRVLGKYGDQCGVGILVTPRLVLTAKHVIEDARRVGISSSVASEREVTYDIPGGQAEVHTIAGREYDIAFLELKSDWSGALPDSFPPLTRVHEEDLTFSRALRFATFHNTAAAYSCKGNHQGSSQGYQEIPAQALDATYSYLGGEYVRLTPALDEAYSGSPLLMVPCGKRPLCVVGVQSSKTNDADGLTSLVVNLTVPSVGTFVHDAVGVGLEDFAAVNTAPEGLSLYLGPTLHVYSGAALNGTSVGVQGGAKYLSAFDRLREYGAFAAASVAPEWYLDGELETVIRSPNGSWQGAGGSERLKYAVGLEVAAGLEGFRSSWAPVVVSVGWYLGLQGLTDRSELLDGAISTGWTAHVGTRVRFSSRWFTTFGVVGRALTHSYDGARYTLIPNRYRSTDESSRGYSIALETAVGFFGSDQ